MNFKIEDSGGSLGIEDRNSYERDSALGTDNNKVEPKGFGFESIQGSEEPKTTSALNSVDGNSSDHEANYIRFEVDEEGAIKIVDGKMYDRETLLSSLKECLRKVGKLDKRTRHELFQKVCAAFGLPIELVSHLDDETDPQKGVSVILSEKIPESAVISSQGGVVSRELTANADEEPYSGGTFAEGDDGNDGDDDD